MKTNKLKIFLGLFVLPAIGFLALTSIALAQDTPAPYTGMKNPFKWNDSAATRAGKSVYLKSCFSCHGETGADVIDADFSTPEFASKLEARPDYYFYIASEGIKDTEMAGYKHTVTETQRWQVLTYIYTLGYVPEAAAPKEENPNVTPVVPPDQQNNNVKPDGGEGQQGASGEIIAPPPPPPPPVEVKMTVAEKAHAGEPLPISVKVSQGDEAIPEVPVTFYFRVQYYTNSPLLATLGEAVTDENGIAQITYTPKLTGYVPIIARYTPEGEKPIEISSLIELTAQHGEFYETEVGLEYKGFPPDITLFPMSAWEPREPGLAPVTVFRIPGGLPFIPFAAYLGVVILVWSLYVTVMYQVFRIAPNTKAKGLDPRLLPMAGIGILAVVGLAMVVILITGPYSGHVIRP